MAVVQKTSAQRTFGDFALDMFRNVIIKVLCKRIDLVFDVYREISLKNTERSRRNKTSIEYSSIKADHSIKQWYKFLGSSKNKTELIKFIFGQWQKEEYRSLLVNKEMYVAC